VCEEEAVPTRYVEIRYGVDEDGGGIVITVRDDMAPIEKLVELAERLYEKIARPKVESGERKDVV